MAPPPPAPGTQTHWTPELWLQAFKEVVTAALGLLIVAFTLNLAVRTFGVIGTGDAINAERVSASKDVLLMILGLAGVVIGYYFGRVPADARAAQAQVQSDAATAHSELVSAQAQIAVAKLDETLDGMPQAGAPGDPGTVSAPPERVRDLREIRERFRSIAMTR